MASKFVLRASLLGVLAALANANVEYLYFTAPGGAPYGELAGLYGAQANWRLNSDALDYPDSGYQCVENKDELMRGISLRSISIDPKTRKVLMNHYQEDRRLSLLTAQLCQAQETCENATVTPEWVFNNAQLENKIGPFAYYNSKIYFIFLSEKEDGAGLKQTIELRVFEGCEGKYPVDDWTAFYVSDCSRKLATLEEIKFDIVSPLKVSDTLFITKSGGHTFFLVLFRRGIYNEKGMAVGHKMELIMVKKSSSDTTIKTLHVEELDIRFLRYATFHLGAISMRNNKLCWSSVDRIMCADWSSSGAISNVKAVLPKGNASLACLNAGHPLNSEITTGIAIANTDKEMAIYFGCIAQRSGYGGAGLVRSIDDKISVYPLMVNDTEILAGNMFLMSYCKPPVKPDQGGSSGDDGYRYVFSSGSPAAFCSSTLALCGIISFLQLLRLGL